MLESLNLRMEVIGWFESNKLFEISKIRAVAWGEVTTSTITIMNYSYRDQHYSFEYHFHRQDQVKSNVRHPMMPSHGPM